MSVGQRTGTPPDEAVAAQLRKMLEAPLFSGAAVRAGLLKFLVNSALANRDLSEDIIGYELFHDRYKSDESDIVRVNCSTLRRHLADYYKSDGIRDTVIISLPRGRVHGKSYRVNFRYGISSDAAKKCNMVRNHLRSEYPVGNAYRFLVLSMVIEEEPLYAPAHVSLAECNLWAAVDNSQNWKSATLLDEAIVSVHKAIELSPDLWDAHILLGAISSCKRDWAGAKRAFAEASELAPDETNNSLYYAAYLFTQGNISEGLELVQSTALENPQDAFLQAIYGLFLIGAGKLSEAREALEHEVFSGSSHRLALIFWALTKVSPHTYWINPKTEAERYASDTFFYVPRKRILNNDDLFDLNGPFDLPGNASDAAIVIQEAYEKFNSESETVHAVLLNGFDSVDFCVGLLSYCLAVAGESEQAMLWLTHLSDDSHFFQRAIGDYGLSDVVASIVSLSKAAENQEPLLIWLHLWPTFAPIRHHPAFQELLENLGLPANNVMRFLPCLLDG